MISPFATCALPQPAPVVVWFCSAPLRAAEAFVRASRDVGVGVALQGAAWGGVLATRTETRPIVFIAIHRHPRAAVLN